MRAAIRAWTAERGRPPRWHEWTPSRSDPGVWEAESPRWPSAAVVCDAHDDYRNPWNAALTDAGAPIKFQRWTDDAIRDALAGFWTSTGRVPAPGDLDTTAWAGPPRRPSGDATAASPQPGGSSVRSPRPQTPADGTRNTRPWC
ncbi:MAG TPA: hypothetical protein VGG23_03930, partial [Acidimicrobiales bacterium]